MKAQLLVCGCLLAFCCNALGQKFQPDIGPSVHEFGRPSTGYVEPLPLGDTVDQATLLVSHYTDKADQKPDFVSIEVQKKHDHGYMVYFERQFPANEVPANILTAKTKDVATFDQKRGIVRFQIGPKTFQYTLPSAIATS